MVVSGTFLVASAQGDVGVIFTTRSRSLLFHSIVRANTRRFTTQKPENLLFKGV